MKVVTRFAPSPTGFMHIGGVRTALYAYLWARKHNGTFILRIEDTDKAREVEGSKQHIQDCLTWMGIEWDYGPKNPGAYGSLVQSERLEHFQKAARMLYEKGLAYPDPFTKEELEAMRAEAQAQKKPFLAREHRPEKTAEWDGKTALRFKQTKLVRRSWQDAVRGELSAGPEALEDFIIMKADGYPTYNFAHIVDDGLMDVTHVFRADEFISSTPNYLALYEALEMTPPVFVTLPPILREDRIKKLGKRDGAKDLLEYRDEGYLPETMMNYLALIGWNPGTEQEIFSKEELLKVFEVEKIHVAGGAFDEVKLQWFNREHVLKLSDADFTERIKPFLTDKTRTAFDAQNLWSLVLPVIKDRTTVLSDVKLADEAGEFSFFIEGPPIDPQTLVWKQESPEATKARLEGVLGLLEGVSGPWNAESVKATVWPFAESEGRGQVLWPTRVALTGRDKSPDPFTVAGIIGRDETIARLRAAIAVLS
jgi:glutamyl-tRNA synthetase